MARQTLPCATGWRPGPAHTASYDAVANWLGVRDEEGSPSPETRHLTLEGGQSLLRRKPHQSATFYRGRGWAQVGTVAGAVQLQGKALSHNNIADTDAALSVSAFQGRPA